MDLHGTRHDCLSLGIDDLGGFPYLVILDDLTILYSDICLIPLDALYRVKHVSVFDNIFSHIMPSP